ncbi:MAG: nicotinate-nucleotide adenylyltransferase [Gammaproteobacteria bacterium]|nr:nicotinate-nucleotide adenylyltransferase [Gammaproteobacteria bacterium]MBT8076883.1 nicotinate-nucleotide adenylyltransferase [Gammaproteobacteria bacterium]NNK99874.1 nicotinate-nucleotide adenylyltransferase [Xanthomonadales bacterium]
MNDKQRSGSEPLALFGGTFDPVHYGHLRCADEAREMLRLETLYLLPAGTPVHRRKPGASARQRLDMLRLALNEFPQLDIDEREIRRQGPSFMVDTLQELRTEFPQRPLLLLVGQDAVNLLHTWSRWQQLLELTHLVIVTRPGASAKYRDDVRTQIESRTATDLQQLSASEAGSVYHLAVTAIDVSATSIKRIIGTGRSPGPMLPAAVLDYIGDNGLYVRSNER